MSIRHKIALAVGTGTFALASLTSKGYDPSPISTRRAFRRASAQCGEGADAGAELSRWVYSQERKISQLEQIPLK